MKQAMIFAAGLGTRLKPLTDTMPKALVPVASQPLLWHVVQKLKAAGFERIVVNVHHFAQQIIDYLQANNNFGLDIRISDETDGLLETGGGIKKALPLFDASSPVLIHNVDILSNVDLQALYAFAEQSATDALLLVSRRKTKRYLLFDDEYLLDGWTNIETGEVRSPYPSLDPTELKQLAFSGIHVLSPRVFPLFDEMPSRFGIIDFYLKYCHQCAFLGYEKKDLRLMDVGKLDTLSEAEAFLQDVLAK
ncbi:MAG: nucleotidyltransferase family protein [Paludibacteraceae bacterium]|nr:nucleotidyltransferase family protein [Paludibacteraceae bacterium]MBQ9672594.1 nucleotidyltransferase family protein [Prevotella sp.]